MSPTLLLLGLPWLTGTGGFLSRGLIFWFIEMRVGIDTGGYQGLPQTGTTPLVHDETAVAWHTTWVFVLPVTNYRL